MLNTVAMADTYFSTNFFSKDAWSSISQSDKESVLSTAEIDVNSIMGMSTVDQNTVVENPPFTSYQMAIFEWACYMYGNKTKITRILSDKVAGVTSVEVDGIGKESYWLSSGYDTYTDMMYKSPAGKYLRMINQDCRIIR